jgi:hypothetical protein
MVDESLYLIPPAVSVTATEVDKKSVVIGWTDSTSAIPSDDFDRSVVVGYLPYLVAVGGYGAAIRGVRIGNSGGLRTLDSSVLIGDGAADNVSMDPGGASLNNSVVIGVDAGAGELASVIGDWTIVGYRAGNAFKMGTYTTLIGSKAGQAIAANSGTLTIVGGNALSSLATAAASATVVGASALSAVTTLGTNLVAVGASISCTGDVVGTGNVAIGQGINLAGNYANQIVVGQGALGKGANSWTVGKLGTKQYISEGANAAQGQSTLVAGTITVTNTLATASSRIYVCRQEAGGTLGHLSVTRAAGSFTINSSSGTDTSTVVWEIKEAG